MNTHGNWGGPIIMGGSGCHDTKLVPRPPTPRFYLVVMAKKLGTGYNVTTATLTAYLLADLCPLVVDDISSCYREEDGNERHNYPHIAI